MKSQEIKIRNLLKRLDIDGLNHYVELGVLSKDATLLKKTPIDQTKYELKPANLQIKAPSKAGSHVFETAQECDNGSVSGFLNTVFRGFKTPIDDAARYIKTVANTTIKPEKTGSDGIFDLVVSYECGSNVIEQVMKQYPELKMISFYAMRNGGIYVCFSAPGFGYITENKFISDYEYSDRKQYPFSHRPDEDSFVVGVNDATKKGQTFKYKFPYFIEWRKYDCLLKQDGLFYTAEPIKNYTSIGRRRPDPIRETLIPESAKEKKSEFFELDGVPFRVIYQPKAALNRLEEWIKKFDAGDSSAMTMEYATEIHHTYTVPKQFVSASEAEQKYIDFVKVCLLYTEREMMEKALRSALKKKDGTLMGKRVQHLAFTGLSVNFDFYELCAVNDTENVMVLEIRSTGCSHKYLPAYEAARTCREILAESEG